MFDTKTVVALVGNPNCGKTTLFNELTGSNYDVGNRIGVTVESKKGICRYNKNMLIVDLPGIYSLSPNSAEEIITHDFIINEKPDLILNIVDATNLERNLYEIVTRQGGYIKVVSEPGKGSEFSIMLPLR